MSLEAVKPNQLQQSVLGQGPEQRHALRRLSRKMPMRRTRQRSQEHSEELGAD